MESKERKRIKGGGGWILKKSGRSTLAGHLVLQKSISGNTYRDPHSNGIQQAASRAWAASSIMTRSKWSRGTCFRGPSLEAETLVDKITSALSKICFNAFSSLSLNSLRRDFISARKRFLSPEFRQAFNLTFGKKYPNDYVSHSED